MVLFKFFKEIADKSLAPSLIIYRIGPGGIKLNFVVLSGTIFKSPDSTTFRDSLDNPDSQYPNIVTFCPFLINDKAWA